MAALFAAAIHDVDHPGLTNQFLINTSKKIYQATSERMDKSLCNYNRINEKIFNFYLNLRFRASSDV